MEKIKYITYIRACNLRLQLVFKTFVWSVQQSRKRLDKPPICDL